MDAMTRTMALAALARLRQRDSQYADDCADWARQGYRPHYCKHGANMWVDYDVICFHCEESLSIYEEAIRWGRENVERADKMIRHLSLTRDIYGQYSAVYDAAAAEMRKEFQTMLSREW